MNYTSTLTKTALITFALIGIYKTSKKQVIASAMTVASVSGEASNYICKHYNKHYKKL